MPHSRILSSSLAPASAILTETDYCLNTHWHCSLFGVLSLLKIPPRQGRIESRDLMIFIGHGCSSHMA